MTLFRRRYPWIMSIHSSPVGPGAGRHQGSGTVSPPTDAVQAPSLPGKTAPLLDPAVLRTMAGDFTDASVVARFAGDFAASLDHKLDRLDRRIQDGDATGAEDAALSVTTSTALVGALRLNEAALATRRLIAADDLDGAQRCMALLRACAADTLRELEGHYSGRG